MKTTIAATLACLICLVPVVLLASGNPVQPNHATQVGAVHHNTATMYGISPTEVNAGGGAFVLEVFGTGLSGGTVYWGTHALTTLYDSDTQLNVFVPAIFTANTGSHSISVSFDGGLHVLQEPVIIIVK